MSQKTSIEVTLKTWQALNQRKRRPGESFDDVIQRLLGDESAEGTDERRTEAPDSLDELAGSLSKSMNESQRRSLVVALKYLREHETAQTSDIVGAAYEAEPESYASEKSWRSNLWNNVTGDLQERGVLELKNRSRGVWRWVGQ